MRTNNTGQPIPNSPYAVSVSLDSWDDVIGYEEGEERVISAMQSGYPRFRFDNFYAALKDTFNMANSGKFAMPFPSEQSARKCIRFVGYGYVSFQSGVSLAIMPVGYEAKAKAFWQHAGLIVSGRQAENILLQRYPQDAMQAKAEIKKRIAELAGERSENVYLYPTGMAAVFSAYETVTELGRNGKTVQLGFPYVDSLKIQEKFGRGSVYVPYNSSADLENLEAVLKSGGVSAVFCEIPGNPLLHTIDLVRLRKLLDAHGGIPLIIDDTIATFANVNLSPFADIIVSSLTKSFSGGGDVMGGSLVLNSHSELYDTLKTRLDNYYEDIFYPDDAIVLEKNSRDFAERQKAFNANGEILAEFLVGHPAVETVFYPKFIDRPEYEALMRPGGGYGSLLSFVTKDRGFAKTAFDKLDGFKGPSLGFDNCLVCPYTKLAHYAPEDRKFAADNGVDWDLIRVSVGLEDPVETVQNYAYALG